MIFDTHAHYYDGAFDADRDELLASLPEKGVALVVCPGCDLESSRACLELAGRYEGERDSGMEREENGGRREFHE